MMMMRGIFIATTKVTSKTTTLKITRVTTKSAQKSSTTIKTTLNTILRQIISLHYKTSPSINTNNSNTNTKRTSSHTTLIITLTLIIITTTTIVNKRITSHPHHPHTVRKSSPRVRSNNSYNKKGRWTIILEITAKILATITTTIH